MEITVELKKTSYGYKKISCGSTKAEIRAAMKAAAAYDVYKDIEFDRDVEVDAVGVLGENDGCYLKGFEPRQNIFRISAASWEYRNPDMKTTKDSRKCRFTYTGYSIEEAFSSYRAAAMNLDMSKFTPMWIEDITCEEEVF